MRSEPGRALSRHSWARDTQPKFAVPVSTAAALARLLTPWNIVWQRCCGTITNFPFVQQWALVGASRRDPGLLEGSAFLERRRRTPLVPGRDTVADDHFADSRRAAGPHSGLLQEWTAHGAGQLFRRSTLGSSGSPPSAIVRPSSGSVRACVSCCMRFCTRLASRAYTSRNAACATKPMQASVTTPRTISVMLSQ